MAHIVKRLSTCIHTVQLNLPHKFFITSSRKRIQLVFGPRHKTTLYRPCNTFATFFFQLTERSETYHSFWNLKWEVHHVQAQAFHHDSFHESALIDRCLLETTTSGFEGTSRDGNDWDVLAVAELDHIPVWVMEEHLVDLDPIVLHHGCHIPHPHILQPPLNKSNISALHDHNQNIFVIFDHK